MQFRQKYVKGWHLTQQLNCLLGWLPPISELLNPSIGSALDPVPTNLFPGKQQMMAQFLGSLRNFQEGQTEFRVPGFSQAVPWVLQALWKWTSKYTPSGSTMQLISRELHIMKSQDSSQYCNMDAAVSSSHTAIHNLQLINQYEMLL